jgi:3',5'-cyclic-AMP phosphodiesterase
MLGLLMPQCSQNNATVGRVPCSASTHGAACPLRLSRVQAVNKVIILSDPHMVPAGETIAGIDPAARLAAGIEHINLHHADADRAVVLGDLTHRGDAESAGRIASLLARLQTPFSIVPGNHDDREVLHAAFPDLPVDGAGYMQQVIDLPGGRLLLLDTHHAEPGAGASTHAGRLCRSRLQWLERRLAESRAEERPVHILMHHPPHPTGFANMDAIMLENGDAFYRVLERNPIVRHLTCGHVHRTISGVHRGLAFNIFKSTAHQQPGIFDDDDSSLSVDEPAAYGLLLIHARGVTAHSEDFELAATGVAQRRSTAADAL